MFLVTVLICGSVFSASAEIDFEFISDYFYGKNVIQLHLFLCSKEDGISALRSSSFDKLLSVTYVNRTMNWTSFDLRPSGLYVDLKCDYNKRFFDEVPRSHFILGYSWFIRGELEEVIPILEKNPNKIGLSTDLVVKLQNSTLFDLYRINANKSIKIIKCREDRIQPCPIIKTRFNLEGEYLKGSIVNILQLNNDEKGRHDFHWEIRNRSYGSKYEILVRRFYLLNVPLCSYYNYKIFVVFTDKWGYKLPDGTFNGVVDDVRAERADFGLTPLSITYDRAEAVNFAAPLEHLVFIFVYLEERSFGTLTALVIPFDINVWITIGIISFIGITVTTLIFYIYRRKENSLSEGIINFVGVMSSQGVLEVNVLSARILNVFLLTLGLLLATFYNASIMNGLLSPVPDTIKSVQQLLSVRKIGIANISYMNPVFYHPLLLKKTIEENVPVFEVPESIKKIQQENYAMAGGRYPFYAEIETSYSDEEKCSARQLGMGNHLTMSVPVPKISHYREMLRIGHIWLKENGINMRVKKLWYPPIPQCLGGIVFKPVALKAVTIAISIYIFGLVLSVIIFNFEVYFHRKIKSRRVIIIPRQFIH